MSAFIPWCWEYTIILLMILPGLAMSIAILFFGWEGRSLRIIYRDNGDEYLRRYAIRAQQEENQDSAWRIFLHHFLLPDGDAHLHNHPWVWSFSIVLWGSYEEEYFNTCDCPQWDPRMESCGSPENHHVLKRRTIRFFNFIPEGRYHKVTKLNGKVWTLFFSGPRAKQDWGWFVPGRGHVQWEQYLEERKQGQHVPD